MYHIHIMQKKTFPTHSRFCLQFTLPFFFLLPVFHLLYWEKFHRKMMIHSWDKWHEEGNESFCIYFMEKRKKSFFFVNFCTKNFQSLFKNLFFIVILSNAFYYPQKFLYIVVIKVITIFYRQHYTSLSHIAHQKLILDENSLVEIDKQNWYIAILITSAVSFFLLYFNAWKRICEWY